MYSNKKITIVMLCWVGVGVGGADGAKAASKSKERELINAGESRYTAMGSMNVSYISSTLQVTQNVYRRCAALTSALAAFVVVRVQVPTFPRLAGLLEMARLQTLGQMQ